MTASVPDWTEEKKWALLAAVSKLSPHRLIEPHVCPRRILLAVTGLSLAG